MWHSLQATIIRITLGRKFPYMQSCRFSIFSLLSTEVPDSNSLLWLWVSILISKISPLSLIVFCLEIFMGSINTPLILFASIIGMVRAK